MGSRIVAAAALAALLAGCSVVPPAARLPEPATSAPVAQTSPTAPATPVPTPTTSAPPVAAPVAEPVPLPEADQLAKVLAKVSTGGVGTSAVVVVDPASGERLASRGDKPLIPASTMKVLTSLVAVDTVGPDATFTTAVVAPEPGRLVLVGGGDPMLTDKQSKSAAKKASLQALADQTIAALQADGVTAVRLGYDTSLFAGPAWHPSWKPEWKVFTARVGALSINGGQVNQWQAHSNPAKVAAEAFATRLKAAGIKVTKVAPEPSPAGAQPVASVQSAPLSAIVGQLLRVSDNHAAEVLARHIALATGGTPSFEGGTAAVVSWLKAHDLWASGMRIDDASGLSRKSKVRPSVLADALALALVTPRWAAVAKGLPVAGVNGTLKTRFNDPAEKAGRNVVHAKTGTLQGVASLAGYVTTKDGAVLTFAAVANDAGRDSAYNWLDRTATALAKCGCRANP
ncbi:MAG: D-alanyl-D-alanine carboxypeptidase/D-alanyl-D-alanine-endopeptidase [Propionibacteriaceae bacterium]|nr:D-alanyl-D-alanine carboxypeptidase/D-alanyl-D-alanine-endopeptidase [Propionibacteriaceae bacterium]